MVLLLLLLLSTYKLHFDFLCRHLMHALEIRFTAGDLDDEASSWPSMDSEDGYCSAFPVLFAGRSDMFRSEGWVSHHHTALAAGNLDIAGSFVMGEGGRFG